MLKLLLISCLLIKTASAQRVNVRDTICPEVSLYQHLVIKANERDNLKEQLSIAEARISWLQTVISQQQVKDSTTIRGYENELAVNLAEQKVLLDAITSKDKEIRRYKRRLFISRAAGVVATGIMGYFYLTK